VDIRSSTGTAGEVRAAVMAAFWAVRSALRLNCQGASRKKQAPAKARPARMTAIQPGRSRNASRRRPPGRSGAGSVLLGQQPPDLGDDAGHRRLRHRQHLDEPLVRAVVRVGDLVAVGVRVEIPQQPDLVPLRLAQHPLDQGAVIPIGRQHQVDLGQIGPGQLPCGVLGRIAGLGQHPDRTAVRAGAHVPVAGAGAAHPDLVVEPGLLQGAPQHLLADGGAADVAGADHADVQPGVGGDPKLRCHRAIVPQVADRTGRPGLRHCGRDPAA
jgi:hypothetical protein